MSSHKKKFPVRIVLSGLLLQFLLAVFALKTSWGLSVFEWLQSMVLALLSYCDEGSQFVFGNDFEQHFFAFKVLPSIIFFSCLSYILFYLGLLQKLISAMAFVMKKTMGVSGAESMVAAGNVFLGQTEAPLFVKPYIPTMTRSEINAMMTSGMATIAGGVLAAFASMDISVKDLIAASVMSAPAALLIAKVILPELESPKTLGGVSIELKAKDVNIWEAAVNGVTQGLQLAFNVGAILLVFTGLVALVNGLISGMETAYFALSQPGLAAADFPGWSLQKILGALFTPFAWLMGVPFEDLSKIGSLLGMKMVLNEFYAYVELQGMIKAGSLSPKSIAIATYALCGFANFSSIAIQVGGIGNLVESRRKDFARYGMRAMLGGTLAAMMTACFASLFYS
jgi:CNT family concentrative nucleoside transporter